MRAPRAFLSNFWPSALISARAARGNQFDYLISYVHHDPEMMCTKFHLDRTKNARSARIFVHFCTFRADFRALRARKSKFEKAITCGMVQRPIVPNFVQFHAFLGQLCFSFLFVPPRMRLIPLPLLLHTNGLHL